MDGFSDQIVSAATAARSALTTLHPLKVAKELVPHVLAYIKRYWVWLLYFILLRKVLRMIVGPRSKKSKHHRSHRRAINDIDAGDSVNSGGSSNTGSTDRSSYAPYFSVTSDATPGTNQVIVGDGVIVVNRNDRYVEVYERKNVAKVDNVDEQVEALLKEFSSRNRK